MRKQLAIYLPMVLAFVALASQVQATPIFVGSRVALGGNDFVDWGQLGPVFTVVPSPSNGGIPGITMTSNGTSMERRDQGNGWRGNFALGDHLIWNQDTQGNIIIDFSTGIFGAGAQVQSDIFGPFTGTISAFDQSMNLLGIFNFNGTSTTDGDNSAVFAGVLDTSPDIFRLAFSATDQFGSVDFAINHLDLVTGAQSVPETGMTLFLMVVALVGLGLMRRLVRA